VTLLRDLASRLATGWRRLRAWRRIRFTGAGVVFTVGTLAVGFAAINTGNNLLYLLLGALLGFLVLSGWLSEQSIRKISVRRHVPVGTPVDRDVRVHYRVANGKRFFGSMALEVGEASLAGRAFFDRIDPGETREGRIAFRFVRRGVRRLDSVTLATTFPFGLFWKERDIELPGEIVVWPRSDREIRAPRPSGHRASGRGTARIGAVGHRGEYRNLREYRPSDDRRDIHWRRSARLTVPVIREYEVEGADSFWICVDGGAAEGEKAEAALEIAAALAVHGLMAGRRFGLNAGGRTLEPGNGRGHLEAVFDALARVDFDPSKPAPAPPAEPGSCVLVSVTGRGRERFGDSYVVGAGGGTER